MSLTPAQMKPKLFESWQNFFFNLGCVSCLHACLGTRLLAQPYQYPNLSEGAERVGGQLRGDKEFPFSGVTKSGRVWRKVPESAARNVTVVMTSTAELTGCHMNQRPGNKAVVLYSLLDSGVLTSLTNPQHKVLLEIPILVARSLK